MSLRHPISFGCAVPESLPAGYPIRTSGDQGTCAPPPGFSQLVASFIARQLQGIRHGPMFAWPYGLFTLQLCLLAFLPCTFQTSWDSAPRPLPFLGQTRVELVTPALSERCSNQLSYCPFCCPSAPSGKEKRLKSRQRLCTVHRYFPFLLERR